jgi:hypothetical protein
LNGFKQLASLKPIELLLFCWEEDEEQTSPSRLVFPRDDFKDFEIAEAAMGWDDFRSGKGEHRIRISSSLQDAWRWIITREDT